MNFAKVIVALLGMVLLGGCGFAEQVNMKNADKYYDLGLQAEAQGNYAGAREAFWRAWVNARDGNGSPEYQSAVLYNLGRMTGYTCNFPEAENLLREALDRELKISGPESANISKRLFELARLNYDQKKYAQAAEFYERAIPACIHLGCLESDPIIVANSYDELNKAYESVGDLDKAKNAAAKAAEIRAKNPGAQAQFVPVRYNSMCKLVLSLILSRAA
ncbi:MAG: tetratricopeptide repeat protein [Gammaproteobacteria bacterium]